MSISERKKNAIASVRIHKKGTAATLTAPMPLEITGAFGDKVTLRLKGRTDQSIGSYRYAEFVLSEGMCCRTEGYYCCEGYYDGYSGNYFIFDGRQYYCFTLNSDLMNTTVIYSFFFDTARWYCSDNMRGDLRNTVMDIEVTVEDSCPEGYVSFDAAYASPSARSIIPADTAVNIEMSSNRLLRCIAPQSLPAGTVIKADSLTPSVSYRLPGEAADRGMECLVLQSDAADSYHEGVIFSGQSGGYTGSFYIEADGRYFTFYIEGEFRQINKRYVFDSKTMGFLLYDSNLDISSAASIVSVVRVKEVSAPPAAAKLLSEVAADYSKCRLWDARAIYPEAASMRYPDPRHPAAIECLTEGTVLTVEGKNKLPMLIPDFVGDGMSVMRDAADRSLIYTGTLHAPTDEMVAVAEASFELSPGAYTLWGAAAHVSELSVSTEGSTYTDCGDGCTFTVGTEKASCTARLKLRANTEIRGLRIRAMLEAGSDKSEYFPYFAPTAIRVPRDLYQWDEWDVTGGSITVDSHVFFPDGSTTVKLHKTFDDGTYGFRVTADKTIYCDFNPFVKCTHLRPGHFGNYFDSNGLINSIYNNKATNYNMLFLHVEGITTPAQMNEWFEKCIADGYPIKIVYRLEKPESIEAEPIDIWGGESFSISGDSTTVTLGYCKKEVT